MDSQSRSTKARHIPRRSGVGMRQAIPAATPKPKRLRFRPTAPLLCGAVHPERPGIVDHETGEQLVTAATCGRELGRDDKGKPVEHKGEHRARLIRGHVERWATETEVAR